MRLGHLCQKAHAQRVSPVSEGVHGPNTRGGAGGLVPAFYTPEAAARACRARQLGRKRAAARRLASCGSDGARLWHRGREADEESQAKDEPVRVCSVGQPLQRRPGAARERQRRWRCGVVRWRLFSAALEVSHRHRGGHGGWHDALSRARARAQPRDTPAAPPRRETAHASGLACAGESVIRAPRRRPSSYSVARNVTRAGAQRASAYVADARWRKRGGARRLALFGPDGRGHQGPSQRAPRRRPRWLWAGSPSWC